MMASEPLLPVELEREIFEFTAHMHPDSIPTLLQVARRVLIWAIKSKPPAFFREGVRHLYLGNDEYRSLEEAAQVLRVCAGVVNLAVMSNYSHPTILPILAEMKIQRMAVNPAVLFGNRQAIYLRHQSFAHITHLDVFGTIGEEDAHLYAQITALPTLTHLCLNGPAMTGHRNLPSAIRVSRLALLATIGMSGRMGQADYLIFGRWPMILWLKSAVGI
ncbi:hypothetical protein B0H11DRAFT_2191114 [Mycena galericulata]|nr:hypothetical protein B0H11DRAFT_2191114 [Mycena galericulata]